jgi:membrane fusion protein (multidrug efflux system)
MVVRRILIAVIGVFMLCSVAGAQGPPPAKVVLGQVTKENVSTNQTVTGVIYYERVSDISTEVGGIVEIVEVGQGDHVKKGDPLVRLNTEILEREISLTKTRVEQIELRIQNTQKNFKRLERLYKSSGVSEKDYDDAQYTFQDAQKEKKIAQDNLGKLLIQKRRSVISAPFGGIVLTKDVDSGAWVQQGKQLVSIGSSSDLFVRAPIAEKLLQFIQLGEKVEVMLNAFNKRIEGEVLGIDPVADLKTKNIFLKIKIPAMPFVAQNMSADVSVPSSSKRELSVFSRAALIKFQGKDFVYSIKEGKAAILPVHIVAFLGDRVAVDTEYIVPGMPLVVEGNERLRPDQAVMVAGEKK